MSDPTTMDIVKAGLPRRYRSERRFRVYGITAIAFALTFLVFMFGGIFSKGIGAFQQTEIGLVIDFDQSVIDPKGNRHPHDLRTANYLRLVKKAWRDQFPDVTGRRDKRALHELSSSGTIFILTNMVLEDPSIVGTRRLVWLPAGDDVDMAMKGKLDLLAPQSERRLNDKQVDWLTQLKKKDRIRTVFNPNFFTAGDSREPELAGIGGALMGSFLTLAVTLLMAFPLAVMTAVYLEEFAPKNRWTELVEVNINNLAAVPSIVFGLLGLAVFLNFFNLPRSSPLVGGMVLTLMTLPTIIIAGRAALKAVPPSIREAALGVGASPVQATFHHVLPLAMPGMLTGTIIGMAQALGETAPLLMIGMVAFVVDIPGTVVDAATALPVQIFLWAGSAERAFEERTSAAIIVLLGFLVCMNILAVIMRRKFETRW